MNSNTEIKIQVGHWGESVSMFALLVDKSIDENGKICGFMRKEWFPKSICKVERIEGYNDPKHPTIYPVSHVLTCPKWLLDKKGVEYDKEP